MESRGSSSQEKKGPTGKAPETGFLGSGMTVRDYAAKVGMDEHTLQDRVRAAKVVTHVRHDWSAAFDGTLRKARTMFCWPCATARLPVSCQRGHPD